MTALGATTEAHTPTITQLLDNYETAVRKSANYGTSQYECDVIEAERAVVNRFDALTEANKKLREALKQYGSHDSDCMKVNWTPPRDCTCGLEAAIASVTP